MKLRHGLHLAYCTNIHRGESWAETLDALQRYTLAVRRQVCPDRPYAIGLRLSDQASRELSEPARLRDFQRWLIAENCYVFTINGFPYGRFHGTRVKEQVYAPDWTTPERLAYTVRLFDLLVELVPQGVAGSVSTVPGSFKEFIREPGQVAAMRGNLWKCVEHLDCLKQRTGKLLHLGLEPEPLCFLETTEETVEFIGTMRKEHPGDRRLNEHLGVNYDACHLAVEFEDAGASLKRLRDEGIRISKLHLSSALSARPRPEVCRALAAFADDTYFHQVIAQTRSGNLVRYKDLLDALHNGAAARAGEASEWRIHFHIPLHSQPTSVFGNTIGHLLGVLDFLGQNPALCSHLEMETYTWEVMPPELKNRDVVDQLVAEYGWTLAQLTSRGLA
jgi:hypothetical protein